MVEGWREGAQTTDRDIVYVFERSAMEVQSLCLFAGWLVTGHWSCVLRKNATDIVVNVNRMSWGEHSHKHTHMDHMCLNVVWWALHYFFFTRIVADSTTFVSSVGFVRRSTRNILVRNIQNTYYTNSSLSILLCPFLCPFLEEHTTCTLLTHTHTHGVTVTLLCYMSIIMHTTFLIPKCEKPFSIFLSSVYESTLGSNRKPQKHTPIHPYIAYVWYWYIWIVCALGWLL